MRSFLALDLPTPVRETLGRLTGRLRRDLEGWRWVRPEGIHLTLRFLGDVDEDLDRGSRAAWAGAAAAAAGAIGLSLGSVGCFGSRRTPRVLWVAVRERGAGDRLARLAGALEGAAQVRGFPPERRPFRPHLTLARAGRDGRAVAPAIDGPAPLRLNFEVGALTLFGSQLLSDGARYTVLERFPLGPRDGGHPEPDDSTAT